MKDTQIVGAALGSVLPQTSLWWFQQPHLLQLNLLLLIPLLSSSVSGYDGSLMNGLQSLSQWKAYFGDPTGTLLGLINAAQSIGSVLAIPFLGHLSDKFGRKPVLVAGLLMIVVATVLQAASVHLAMFIVARLVTGFGGMFVVQPSPMLIAELAYPTHRGKYTCAFWTMYYLGAILASWTTYGTQTYTSDWSWRIPCVLQAGIPIIQLLFVALVPESPRWLVSQDRVPEAAAILTKYHAGHVPPLPTPSSSPQLTPLVHLELSEMVQSIQSERAFASTSTWTSLVSSPGNRRRTLIVLCVGAFAQWNGIGVVSYYLTLVLDTVGITASSDQTLINGLLQVFNFVASGCAAALVDRLGRRTLFLWSSIGMLAAYVVWTACSALVEERGDKKAGYVVVVCLFVYYFHYDIAWTPLLFGYPTEILPYSLRSKGLAVELFAIYGSLVVLAFVNPIGMDAVGWKYYILFCVLLALFLPVAWWLFPETKGYSLEEIAVIFDGEGAGLVESGGSEREKRALAEAAHVEKAEVLEE